MLGPRGQIPQPDRPSPDDHRPAVRRERTGGAVAVCLAEAASFLPRGEVPQSSHAIVVTRNQRFAVWGEDDRSNVRWVWSEAARVLTRCHIPKADVVVRGRAGVLLIPLQLVRPNRIVSSPRGEAGAVGGE